MAGAPVHTGAYGLTPVEGGPQAAAPSSTRMRHGGWPVRSGAVPPADDAGPSSQYWGQPGQSRTIGGQASYLIAVLGSGGR